MDGFEFIFGLFGLILGLALAEALSSLSNAIKARHSLSIGWPTVLLGLFVSCDIVTFWMYGWSMREKIPVTWPFLFGGFVVTATYYVSASLVFPNYPEEWSKDGGNLNAHFDANRRLVLTGVLLCNVALLSLTVWMFGSDSFKNFRTIVVTWSFFPVILLAIATKRRWVVIGCVLWLIALYPLSVLWPV